MKTLIFAFFIFISLGVVSSSSSRRVDVTKKTSFQELINDIPAAAVIVKQNKEYDQLSKKMELVEKELECIEVKVDTLTVAMEDRKTVRRLKRAIKKEERAALVNR